LSEYKDEKRKVERIHFETKVVLKSDSSEVVAETTSANISANGIYIKSDQKIPVGSTCFLELSLRGISSQLLMNIKGHVVRHDDNGMGIEFIDLEMDSYFHLNNIFKHSVLDPKTITNSLFFSEE
jgi:hypothetical protein